MFACKCTYIYSQLRTQTMIEFAAESDVKCTWLTNEFVMDAYACLGESAYVQHVYTWAYALNGEYIPVFESNLNHAWPLLNSWLPPSIKNRAGRGFLCVVSAAYYGKDDSSSASESAFLGILGCSFYMLNFSKKRFTSNHSAGQSWQMTSVFQETSKSLCLCLFVSVPLSHGWWCEF